MYNSSQNGTSHDLANAGYDANVAVTVFLYIKKDTITYGECGVFMNSDPSRAVPRMMMRSP